MISKLKLILNKSKKIKLTCKLFCATVNVIKKKFITKLFYFQFKTHLNNFLENLKGKNIGILCYKI